MQNAGMQIIDYDRRDVKVFLGEVWEWGEE